MLRWDPAKLFPQNNSLLVIRSNFNARCEGNIINRGSYGEQILDCLSFYRIYILILNSLIAYEFPDRYIAKY